jgi:hypothetical protein
MKGLHETIIRQDSLYRTTNEGSRRDDGYTVCIKCKPRNVEIRWFVLKVKMVPTGKFEVSVSYYHYGYS